MYDIDTNKKKQQAGVGKSSSANPGGDRGRRNAHSSDELEAEDFNGADDRDDDEPSVGDKRKNRQLEKVLYDDDESDAKPQPPSNKRARIADSEEEEDYEVRAAARRRNNGLAEESDEEDVYRPGATINMVNTEG